ncbi:hypothetical protein ACWIGX_09140 [Streptomyces nigrescens]
MQTVVYRVKGPTWGIAIDLTAGSASAAAPPAGAERISNRIWLDTTPVLEHPPADRSGLRLTQDEVGWLRHGLGLATEAIEAARPPGRHTVVTVHRVLFPAADFQVEGLAGAIVEWSSKEFGIPEVAVGLSFDRAANRFLFDWQPHRWAPGTGVRRVRPARDLRGRPLTDASGTE